jgi:hypothetical protein
VSHHLVGHLPGLIGQHALDQQLELTARGFVAKEAGFDDLGVIEDQQVARLQQTGQIMKDAVYRLGASPIEQARGTANGTGVLGDAVGGQMEIKVAEREDPLAGVAGR